MSFVARFAFIGAAAVVVLSCAGRTGSRSGSRFTVLGGTNVLVEVENQHFNDATVYAVHNGRRLTLGRVTGKTSEVFGFRWDREEIQMFVDFTGGGWAVSESLSVFPGDGSRLRLIIRAGDRRSATLIRR